MAPGGSHRNILLAVGLIGVILSIALLVPEACATAIPSLPEENATSGNASSFEAGPEDETLLPEPASDDERLESLIAGAGIPLLDVSVGQICAAYAGDDAALRSRAADMASLVDGYRADAAALDISPDMAPAYEHFVAALDEFAAAAALDRSEDMPGRLALGTEHLSSALRACNPPASADAPPLLMSAGEEEPAPRFPDALGMGERFCYDDSRKENTISLIASSLTWSYAFQTTGTSPVRYEAAPGSYFLLVAVKATHLGHKGEGVNTRIQTPAESAFTLLYGDATYRPLAPPGSTNRGGSYSRVTLGRGESLSGYLFFEVPEELDLSRAYLRANLGRESPVWLLDG